MKKAIFFTIDSLLASGIIIISILLVSNFYVVEHQKTNINYASQDLVKLFSTMTVGNTNNEYTKILIQSGDITNLNNTILEQIGDFWANEKLNLSLNFIRNITADLIPVNYGFSVFINGEEIYSRNLTLTRALVSSKKIISGIAKAKPTEGYTARVLLNGIKSKRTNAYVYFGGYEGDGNLTKRIILPNDVVSFNSSYLEVDAGSSFNLYINNAFSGTYTKGSGGGGDRIPGKWNISNAYLSNFRAGQNIINLNFTSGSSYIAGGFLRVNYITSSYNDTQTPGFEKYLFPGIDGIINLYSSVYSPGTVNNMQVFLNYSSNYTTYLRLGNTTVYEENPQGAKETTLTNSTLKTLLDYSLFNQKTVPLKMGITNVTVITGGTISDSALITDRTSSMSACDVVVNCTAGLCDSDAIGGCHDRRDNVAIKADKKFIDETLKVQGSKIGLVGYGESLYPFCDFHDFSDDNLSLKYRIGNYSNSWCGNTCISCGILAATELLLEKEALYGLNELFYINSTQLHVGDTGQGVSVMQKLNLSVNKSKFVKSRLSIFGRGIAVNSGYQDCVYLNQKYIGRMCDSSADWHTCSFPLKAELFSDNGNNNITITGGTTAGCFQTAGDNDDWDFNNVKLSVWESETIPKTEYNSSLGEVQIGDAPFQPINTLILNISINKSKARAAHLEFDAIDIALSYFDCVYINGNYVGRVDYQKWNGTNVWQRIIFDVPVAWLENGQNQINMTSGTTSGCLRTSGDNDEWRFRNVNLSVVWTDETPNYDRTKSMLIMSDGQANTKIGDCDGCNSTGARTETIQKACEANDLYGIKVYAVAFGNVGATAIDTLNQSACCDDCSHFYTSNKSDELIEIYTKIAQSIGNITYKEQSINLSAGSIRTSLYPSSYIEFNYTSPEVQFNKVPLSFETDRFGNNVSSGTLTIYANTSVLDARVTSYSGSKWTDNLIVNGNTVYRLTDYDNDYTLLGDPFTVNIPVGNINQGNNSITISTGVNSTAPTGGSIDNRIIYTLLLNGFADYSAVVAKSDGCSWNVAFEDGTFSTIKIPSTYNGGDSCSYTNTSKTYDSNDALNNAVYQLFNNLDVDKDGKLEFNIEESNLNINTLEISKVPSLWGPAIVEIRVWE